MTSMRAAMASSPAVRVRQIYRSPTAKDPRSLLPPLSVPRSIFIERRLEALEAEREEWHAERARLSEALSVSTTEKRAAEAFAAKHLELETLQLRTDRDEARAHITTLEAQQEVQRQREEAAVSARAASEMEASKSADKFAKLTKLATLLRNELTRLRPHEKRVAHLESELTNLRREEAALRQRHTAHEVLARKVLHKAEDAEARVLALREEKGKLARANGDLSKALALLRAEHETLETSRRRAEECRAAAETRAEAAEQRGDMLQAEREKLQLERAQLMHRLGVSGAEHCAMTQLQSRTVSRLQEAAEARELLSREQRVEEEELKGVAARRAANEALQMLGSTFKQHWPREWIDALAKVQQAAPAQRLRTNTAAAG